ncbi:hypothetical protein [Metapseudomonas otitidis]|uniref:hypothetical protein n=1 Tax=Metapseudomonas otitidis TaxID=319939 RepID=UPI00366E8EE7
MTDRELLEAAARAAGINLGLNSPWRTYSDAYGFEWLNADGSKVERRWSPLTDDGDRYRLLQALKMGVDFDAQSVIYTLDGSICEESFRKDGDDARAVLRAAAEIGRARE